MKNSFSGKRQILLRAGVRCSLRRQPAPTASCVLPCQVYLDARQPQHTRCSSSAAGTCGFYHVTKKICGTLPSDSGFTFPVTVDVPLRQTHSNLAFHFSLPQPHMCFLLLSVFFNLIYSFFTVVILRFLPRRL